MPYSSAAPGEARKIPRRQTVPFTPLPPIADATSARTLTLMLSSAAWRGWRAPAGGFEPASRAAARGEHVRLRNGRRHHVGDLRLACGERARLVEGADGDLAEPFEHGTALEKQAPASAGGKAGGDGGRRRDDEGAGQPINRMARPL